MTKSTVWLGTLCLIGAASMAPASANVAVDIDVAPPAPQVEVVPAPRAGYVWAPGYWDWRAPEHHHVWVGGRWLHEHHGRHWVQERWVQDGPHWHMERGRWER